MAAADEAKRSVAISLTSVSAIKVVDKVALILALPDAVVTVQTKRLIQAYGDLVIQALTLLKEINRGGNRDRDHLTELLKNHEEFKDSALLRTAVVAAKLATEQAATPMQQWEQDEIRKTLNAPLDAILDDHKLNTNPSSGQVVNLSHIHVGGDITKWLAAVRQLTTDTNAQFRQAELHEVMDHIEGLVVSPGGDEFTWYNCMWNVDSATVYFADLAVVARMVHNTVPRWQYKLIEYAALREFENKYKAPYAQLPSIDVVQQETEAAFADALANEIMRLNVECKSYKELNKPNKRILSALLDDILAAAEKIMFFIVPVYSQNKRIQEALRAVFAPKKRVKTIPVTNKKYAAPPPTFSENTFWELAFHAISFWLEESVDQADDDGAETASGIMEEIVKNLDEMKKSEPRRGRPSSKGSGVRHDAFPDDQQHPKEPSRRSEW